MTSAGTNVRERRLVEAARGGDENAFRLLIEPHRAALHAHCYRILGSTEDAEDALQDALLRAWRGLSGFHGRSGLRRWLYRIATNASLDVVARRPKSVVSIDVERPENAKAHGRREGAADLVWADAYPVEALAFEGADVGPAARYEEREAVERAFVAAMQHLPARQRAVLVLRDVLGYSAKEVSQSLETTEAAVNSALQRARRAVDERLSGTSREAASRAVGDERLRATAGDFVDAFDRGDVAEAVSMLTEGATVATLERAASHDSGDRKIFPRVRLPDELAA